ncbi:DUF6154 family protein [Radiobacillus kanasensis]|uniref:DUF6154 family protein n=1 Tax=Radiobacillus kanasensis TaxID=2844358 RepID=UPI001E5A9F1A|nr:DUF6154 family protein [Radiobacillus kanasensis]UFT98173.1 DUF6154 family protein [Radiobacillus kanasensis]
MRFANDILERYFQHFNDKESLDVFIYSVLEQMDETDLLQVLKECDKTELNELLTQFLRNKLEHELHEDDQELAASYWTNIQ